MGYQRITGPATEPVSLDEAKQQLYLDSDFQDARVTSLIVAARTYFETQTNRRLISQTWRYSLDHYPRSARSIVLPIGPAISVETLKFLDTNGSTVTVDPSEYLVDLTNPRAQIAPALFLPWPWTVWAFHHMIPGAVLVDFTAGYGADFGDVPEDIRQAILLMVAHWYSNREPVITGVRAAAIDVPHSATAIIDAYRIPSLG
jgi:uncharacterized phiE125 gp8 family phage protein